MQEISSFFCCPVGCRFRPTDKELLGFYLFMKISRMALPPECDALIRDCDLYGEVEPWQIWESYRGKYNKDDDDEDEDEEEEEEEEEDMFFFTQLKKKSVKGSRISRRVGTGSGAWQSEDAAKKVRCGKAGSTLGFKKRLRYENKGSEHDGAWIMHEYSLDSSLLKPHQPNDYVLCRIRRNVNVGKKRKRSQAEEQVKVEDHAQSPSSALIPSNFWNYDEPNILL